MADSARIAQVTAREVPVTIQGSQILGGTDRRELFTETLKTTLISDNGAVINLKAKVTPGQSLFLRNELSGREILCRVVESPAPDQTGPTDLEFTIHDPEFWSAQGKEAADAGEEPGSHEATPAAAESAAAAPNIESGEESSAPATVEVLGNTDEIPATPRFSSLPEIAEASPEPAGEVPADDAKEAEQLAGILAKYARAIANRASAKKAANDADQQPAPDVTQQPQDEPTTRKQKAFSTLAFRLHGIRELTVRKNPIALGIVACVVIAAALGVAWDVTGMLYPASSLSLAAIARMKVPAPHTGAGPSKAASAKAGKVETTPTHVAPKIQPPTVAQVPAARIAKSPAATTGHTGAAPVTYKAAASPSALSSETALQQARHLKPDQPNSQGTIPARIVSQYQPYLPPWAKDLDVDGVVKLDAVIDEKGNLTATKLLSGPRALESAAKGAVGLWLFEPAQSNGKPTATHMILTVEFQR
jgi:hypothetical protein